MSCIWETLHSVQFHNLQAWGQIYHTTIHTAHHTQSCRSCNIKNAEFEVTSDDLGSTVPLLQLHYQLQCWVNLFNQIPMYKQAKVVEFDASLI